MMSTRRTLLAGILLPAFVLFLLPAAVSAQVVAADITVQVSTNGYGSVLVSWGLASGVTDAELATIEGYKVRYEQLDSGVAFGIADVISSEISTNARSYEVDGLKHEERYVFTVGAVIEDVAALTYALTPVEADTLTAPKPDQVDDVVLTPGDGMLMVEWGEGDGNGLDISGYGVQISTKEESGYTSHYFEGIGLSTTISGLTNGTMYYVQVRAETDGGAVMGAWSDAVSAMPMGATPTPALPLFGVIGLGAGLLAAGRTRLRRRRAQRQLTR